MPHLLLEIDWLDPPPEGDAFGPEAATWADLGIILDGMVLTQHEPREGRSRGQRRDRVTGGMSGIAEWIVENWPEILWEVHPPFDKSHHGPVRRGQARIPDLADAMDGWPGQHAYGDSATRLAAWQHQHTLGHACSPIALPSLVFLPEERHVGVSVGRAAPGLDPTVEFTIEVEDAPNLQNPVWIAKDDLADALARVVEGTLERADSRPDGRAWAAWLSGRWKDRRARASDEVERRRMMFGDIVAGRWEVLERSLPDRVPVVEGLLADVEPPRDDRDLDLLVELAEGQGALRFAGASVAVAGQDVLSGASVTPWEQGYRLAELTRVALGDPDGPLIDMRDMLERLGVEVVPCQSRGMFRSAATVDSRGRATIRWARDPIGFQGLAPTRFAIAAALGRIAGDGALHRLPFGAAHGPQSRWRETQRSNAYAAELLLPASVVRSRDDTLAICEEYGVSRSAAEWHTRNRAT